jgi:hypothetical protein
MPTTPVKTAEALKLTAEQWRILSEVIADQFSPDTGEGQLVHSEIVEYLANGLTWT